MSGASLMKFLKQEFTTGWKPFEIAWLAIFIIAQIGVYIYEPDSLLAMISGISGIICVVFVSKGKISNYFFGLIFAYTYFYVCWGANLVGEINTVIYVYIPAQFIGYFLWKSHMQSSVQGAESVIAKSLTVKGWIMLLVAIVGGSLLLIHQIKNAGGNSAGLDGVTTVTVVAAQLLMILRYKEQWLLWIALNILSIVLWLTTAESSYAMVIMYTAYLLNSLYGYYNWRELEKQSNFNKI